MEENKPPRRKITIRIPKFGFNSYGEIDWEKVAGVAFGTLGFVICLSVVIAIGWVMVIKISNMPKNPTTPLTAAQVYAKQCSNNSRSDDSEHPVPNTSGAPNTWTCQYPKEQ